MLWYLKQWARMAFPIPFNPYAHAHIHTHTNLNTQAYKRTHTSVRAYTLILGRAATHTHAHAHPYVWRCFSPRFFSCLFLFYSLIKSVCSVFNAAAVTAAGSLCACICMSSFFPLLDRCTHYSVWPTYTSPKSRKSRNIHREKK